MFKHYSAIITGVVIGITLYLPLNAGLNKLEAAECQDLGDTHSLVTTSKFLGTITQVCLDKQYL